MEKRIRFKQVRDPGTGIVQFERHLVGSKLHRDPREGPASVQRDKRTGAVIAVRYMIDGKLHREDGPALITYTARTGTVRFEQYSLHGLPHRIGGPSLIVRDKTNGRITLECWSVDGKSHRDPGLGPARIEYHHRTGVAYRESYFVEDQYHREDGPARIYRNDLTGVVTAEFYYLRGVEHRVDGPAEIYRHEDGRLSQEKWRSNGQLHRDPAEGPAIIRYDRSGLIRDQEFYVNGAKVEPPRPASRPPKPKGPFRAPS